MIDVEAYCARIGYRGSLEPTADVLRALHLAHVTTVPFENLNNHLGRAVSLEPADLFRKIVTERRGGYCFELNGLFALLLEELGFTVTRLAARVLYQTVGARPRSHQLLLVQIGDERWMVDVGFGGHGLREPLPFTLGEAMRQGPDRFILSRDARGDSLLQCAIDEVWTDLYSFPLDPCLPEDYLFGNYYHSHAPESFFMQHLVCTLPTPNGRTSLTDRTLNIRSGSATTEIHVPDESTCRRLLQEHFGLVIKSDRSLLRAMT